MAQIAVTFGFTKTASTYPELSEDTKLKLNMLALRADVAYDETRIEHVDALRALFKASFEHPATLPRDLKSEIWKDMGWQGVSPATDFRAGGFLSLENLLWLAQEKPELYRALRHKTRGKRSEYEYPFAVAGVNLTYKLVKILDIKQPAPTTSTGACFARLVAQQEDAFEAVYAQAFDVLDQTWLEFGNATYMDFPRVMEITLSKLEKAMDKAQSLEDIATSLGV